MSRRSLDAYRIFKSHRREECRREEEKVNISMRIIIATIAARHRFLYTAYAFIAYAYRLASQCDEDYSAYRIESFISAFGRLRHREMSPFWYYIAP